EQQRLGEVRRGRRDDPWRAVAPLQPDLAVLGHELPSRHRGPRGEAVLDDRLLGEDLRRLPLPPLAPGRGPGGRGGRATGRVARPPGTAPGTPGRGAAASKGRPRRGDRAARPRSRARPSPTAPPPSSCP